MKVYFCSPDFHDRQSFLGLAYSASESRIYQWVRHGDCILVIVLT